MAIRGLPFKCYFVPFDIHLSDGNTWVFNPTRGATQVDVFYNHKCCLWWWSTRSLDDLLDDSSRYGHWARLTNSSQSYHLEMKALNERWSSIMPLTCTLCSISARKSQILVRFCGAISAYRCGEIIYICNAGQWITFLELLENSPYR